MTPEQTPASPKERPNMELTFVAKDPDSVPDGSPALYRTDRESWIVQGWAVTDPAALAALNRALPALTNCASSAAASGSRSSTWKHVTPTAPRLNFRIWPDGAAASPTTTPGWNGGWRCSASTAPQAAPAAAPGWCPNR